MSMYSAVYDATILAILYSVYVEVHIYSASVCTCSPSPETKKFFLLVSLEKMLLLLCSCCSGHDIGNGVQFLPFQLL